MKTILVPTDLSPATEAALTVAVDIARLHGAAIVLLHTVVYPLPMPAYPEAVPLTTDRTVADYLAAEQEAEAALNQLAANEAYAGVTIRPTLITSGQGLVFDVTERPADLIVMASKGASGLEELMLGSNAEVIVRYAHCPVLIIKEPVAHFQPETVVCALDVDDRLKAAHRYPFGLGEKGLHQFLYVLTPTDNRAPDGIRDWVHDFATAKGTTEFTCVLRRAKTVPDGIVQYADEIQADLIVLYTHGRKGIRRLFWGSVAEDVLNRTTRPVLVMRA